MTREPFPCLSSGISQSCSHILLRYEGAAVDRLDELPSYEVFFQRYLLANRPCIFPAAATDGWRSRKDWVTPEGDPNVEFLIEHFGSAEVPVANCSKLKFSSHPKQDMSLREYMDYWKHRTRRNCKPEPCNQETPTVEVCKRLNNEQNTGVQQCEDQRELSSEHESNEDGKCLYLKDWHFTRAFPDYKAYITPVYFRSDWLNEYWDSKDGSSDDYRFVYIGPERSWTPFHADVFRSYSWSANICGRKKWIIYPPGEELCLTDVHGQLVYDVTSPELLDSKKYPRYSNLKHEITVFQEPGEIIFIPSGWHHQVINIEDTISINHNWLNGCNMDLCWKYITQCLRDVQDEIRDCRDMDGWHNQCQLILKASAGIDYSEFLQFVLLISENRLHALCAKSSRCSCSEKADCTASEGQCLFSRVASSNTVVQGDDEDPTAIASPDTPVELSSKEKEAHWKFCNLGHVMFDLVRLRVVIRDILAAPELDDINVSKEILSAKDVLQQISSILDK